MRATVKGTELKAAAYAGTYVVVLAWDTLNGKTPVSIQGVSSDPTLPSAGTEPPPADSESAVQRDSARRRSRIAAALVGVFVSLALVWALRRQQLRLRLRLGCDAHACLSDMRRTAGTPRPPHDLGSATHRQRKR